METIKCGVCGKECHGDTSPESHLAKRLEVPVPVFFTCDWCGFGGTVQNHRRARIARREAVELALLAGQGWTSWDHVQLANEAERFLAALDERHQRGDEA
jgi:hypothetical protein